MALPEANLTNGVGAFDDINILTAYRQDKSEIGYEGDDEPMTKADEATHREALHTLTLAVTTLTQLQAQAQANPSARPQTSGTKWFMGALAAVTLLGGAATFVGNSGMWVGKKDEAVVHQQEKLADEVAARKDLQAKFDKLRDLYMIRFSEDPDKVDTETMKRKKKEK